MKLWKQIREHHESLEWEGNFPEYYDMVKEHPEIARLSHARIHVSIQHPGTRLGRLGETSYALFADELFGIDRALDQVVRHFDSAARGLETRKRILLLVGPPGSGKSTLANQLKAGLERYSQTEQGRMYAIAGCPIQEEPLHLIPAEFRPQAEQELGISIEGDLCPHCRWLLRETYQGNIEEVVVRRVLLSEAAGIGIGTFVATDPRSQKVSRLIGSLDYSLIGEDRLRPSGRAYRLDGELNVANRGLVEFIEIFKLEERFLAILLVLSEELKIKAPSFGTIYVDEAIIAHTNEAEYKAIVEDPRSEALQDRIVAIRVPYNLRVSDEVRIYQKLLGDLAGPTVHLSPLALPVAANLAVLSRLEDTNKWGMTLPLKLSLYDGKYEQGYSWQDVQNMMEESAREGMTGISPRFVINQISNAISKTEDCLDPISLLETIWEGIEQSTALSQMERDRLFALFKYARSEYDRLAIRAVRMAMVEEFKDKADALFAGYLANVEADLTGEPALDESTGKKLPADEQAMRRLESLVDLDGGERARKYRREVDERHKTWESQGLSPDYTSEPRLARAIQTHLLPDRRRVSRVAVPADKLDTERLKERAGVLDRLLSEHGFEKDCAESLLQYVSQTTGHSKKRKDLPKSLRWLRD
ncbi:MAG: protein prkA [Anaerolineales bacterium]